MRWVLCPLSRLGTHQESPRQGAEPLEGVLGGVGAQPSLDGDLQGGGRDCATLSQWGTVATTRTRIQLYRPMRMTRPYSLVMHCDQDPRPKHLQQLPGMAAVTTVRDQPRGPPSATPTPCPCAP